LSSEECGVSQAREQPVGASEERTSHSSLEFKQGALGEIKKAIENRERLPVEVETVPSAENDIKPVSRQEAKVSARISQQKLIAKKENALSEIVDKFFNNVENETVAKAALKKNKQKLEKENFNEITSAPSSDFKPIENTNQ